MQKNRLEAFSDGVIAIIITIMVLEIKVPHEASLEALIHLLPVLLSYVLSFIYVGIYWNNHHHLLHSVHKVSGAVLWANLHLLFWLSLVPLASGWMGENRFEGITVTVYGGVLLMAATAYYILVSALIRHHGEGSLLLSAVGNKAKEKLSLALYLTALPVSLFMPSLALTFYVVVALIWLIPDSRIEERINQLERGDRR